MSVNSKTIVAALGTIAIIGTGFIVWLNRGTSPASSQAHPGSSILRPAQAPLSQTPEARRQLPGGPYEAFDPRWAVVHEKDKADRNWEWRMPINFYGRVVDEKEVPISAAKIYAQWSDLSPNGASNQETESDDRGGFSITGKTGRGITIRVTKEGYYFPTRQQSSFDYAAFWEANYYEADQRTPIVFHLRKKSGTGSVQIGEIHPTLRADGAPLQINLLNGGIPSADGQIQIAATTNTAKYPPRVFDWEAAIAIPDGGLLEHDLEFPFEAPIDGYVPRIEFKMQSGSPTWQRAVEKSYFIRFGNPPQYGRIHIQLNGASQKILLRYAVNPTGSRNLEAKEKED
jgi:hypothetical protein